MNAHPLGKRLLTKALLHAMATQIAAYRPLKLAFHVASYVSAPLLEGLQTYKYHLGGRRLPGGLSLALRLAICALTKERPVSNWFERRWASRALMVSKPSKPAGWYPDPSDPQIEAFWNGAGWTAHKWFPDPKDPEARLFWDGARWTGDRRAATEPPYMPQNIDPSKPQRKDTDWVKVGGIALGVLAALEVATNSSRQATASWDRARAQSDAYARQDRVRQYQQAHNRWVQANWNNPNPPPPPLPPTY